MRIRDWSSDVCSSDLGTTGRTARRGGAWDLRAWSAACGMSSGTACSGVGHGNAPQGAGLTSARGDRNRGPCSPCPAGYDAGTWMGRAAMGDGFVALYIFMLAAIAGNVIISRVPVSLRSEEHTSELQSLMRTSYD